MNREALEAMGDLDDVQYRLECAIKALSCSGSANVADEDFKNIIFSFSDYLWMLNKELDKCLEEISK